MHNVVLLGGTGRTGRCVLAQLLERGVQVRAIVRSSAAIAPELAKNPLLSVTQASLLALSDDELMNQLRGCDAVVSCLGHVISLKGIFGRPRDLVTQATMRVCRLVEALKPEFPVKFVLMTSVSVHRPRASDPRRGTLERALLWLLRALVPPARDNQRAADFLLKVVGASNPFLEWVVVRPDSLLDGGVTEYALHESLVNSLFAPGQTNRSNVAHFMCELVTDAGKWALWKAKLPAIVNAGNKPG